MKKPPHSDAARPLFEAHPRSFQGNRYVYPVLSRRSRGISIGVNLNLDKVCNFHCVYCQVDRTESGNREFVEIDRLVAELDRSVELVASGRIYEHTKFVGVPPQLRRLNDIALSGDGEPTTYSNFEEVISACAEVRRRQRLDDVKLVLITNATMFDRDRVRRALEILDAGGGEIWAKLDAGTENYYRLVARAAIPFQRILANLAEAARVRPIVIQSLFMRIHGQPPTLAEQQAYCDRLGEITATGGQIKLVQVHTIAREPAESWVTPLSEAEIKEIAGLVGDQTGLRVGVYHSACD